MFLKTSRYYKQPVVETRVSAGGVDKSTVKALTLRRLPLTVGSPDTVKGNHRLDIMAQRLYNDPTRFWHIADANSELEANRLVEETGRIIEVPRK
jgi:hypothetical protein